MSESTELMLFFTTAVSETKSNRGKFRLMISPSCAPNTQNTAGLRSTRTASGSDGLMTATHTADAITAAGRLMIR